MVIDKASICMRREYTIKEKSWRTFFIICAKVNGHSLVNGCYEGSFTKMARDWLSGIEIRTCVCFKKYSLEIVTYESFHHRWVLIAIWNQRPIRDNGSTHHPINLQYDYTIKYNVAWHMLFETYEKSMCEWPRYKLHWRKEILIPWWSGTSRWERRRMSTCWKCMVWVFRVGIDEFHHYHLVIVVDATHLCAKYKNKLLMVLVFDVNHNMFLWCMH